MLSGTRRKLMQLPSLLRSDTPVLIVRPAEGLANRLRGLASCQAIANLLALRLEMVWEPGVGFSSERFDDLFANEIDEVEHSALEEQVARGVPQFSDWFVYEGDSKPAALPGFAPGGALATLRRRGFVYPRANDNLVKIMRIRGVRGLGILREEYRRCLRALAPAAPLANEIEAFIGKAFGETPVVGVHIRRGDATNGKYAAQYLASSDAAFRRRLDDISTSEPTTRFFLATDCEETEQRFRAEFTDRIFTRPKTFVASEFGAAKEGQAAATIDLFLLSCTRRIIGTRWSSFGRVASMMGNIRFEEATDRPSKA